MTEINSQTIVLNGFITPYTLDLIEELDHKEFIWYYSSILIIGVEASVRITSGIINLSIDINGLSISESDPLLTVEKESNQSKCLSVIGNNNKLNLGDRLSIHIWEAAESKDLSVKFTYKFV
jgi:hypothetical protein